MTPEKAQYHWMMLRLGQQDAYERELDRLLDEEDPLRHPPHEQAVTIAGTEVFSIPVLIFLPVSL